MMPTTRPIDTAPPADFTPVITDFKCLITDVRDETRAGRNEDSRPVEWFIFDCAELEVLAAREPFTMPVYQVEIRMINMPYSQWAVMKESIRNCGYSGDVNGLIGKHVHFQWAPAIISLPKRDEAGNNTGGYENREGHCWQIVEVEGVENTSNQLEDKILTMADNRNAAAFKAEFLGDMSLNTLTGYDTTANQVIQGQLLPLLVTMGKLSLDENGVYHRV